MWPINIDSSGCKVVQVKVEEDSTPPRVLPPPNGVFADKKIEKPSGAEPEAAFQVVPVHKHDRRQEPEQAFDWLAAAQGGHISLEEDEPKKKEKLETQLETLTHPGLTIEAQGGKIHQEEVVQDGRSNDIGKQLAAAATSTIVKPARTSPSCMPQGLAKPNFERDEKYTLGGMADSMYEYLIKVCSLDIVVLYNLNRFLIQCRNIFSSVVHQTSTRKCMSYLSNKPKNTYSFDLLRREIRMCFFQAMPTSTELGSHLTLILVTW